MRVPTAYPEGMADTGTLTLTDFLLARIAEDETRARDLGADAMMGARWKHHPKDAYDDLQQMGLNYSRRVLAECEAKRRIVEQAERLNRDGCDSQHGIEGDLILRTLAAVYADHPDYRDEWRP